jgi:hypothetical protein
MRPAVVTWTRREPRTKGPEDACLARAKRKSAERTPRRLPVVQSDSVELDDGRARLRSKGALSCGVLCQAEGRLSASRGRFFGEYIVVPERRVDGLWGGSRPLDPGGDRPIRVG